jgi:hypothetical protein
MKKKNEIRVVGSEPIEKESVSKEVSQQRDESLLVDLSVSVSPNVNLSKISEENDKLGTPSEDNIAPSKMSAHSRRNSMENPQLSDEELRSFEVSSVSSGGSLDSFVGAFFAENTITSITNGVDFEKDRFFNCTAEELRLGDVIHLLSLYKLLVVENKKLKLEVERYKRETSQFTPVQNIIIQTKK